MVKLSVHSEQPLLGSRQLETTNEFYLGLSVNDLVEGNLIYHGYVEVAEDAPENVHPDENVDSDDNDDDDDNDSNGDDDDNEHNDDNEHPNDNEDHDDNGDDGGNPGVDGDGGDEQDNQSSANSVVTVGTRDEGMSHNTETEYDPVMDLDDFEFNPEAHNGLGSFPVDGSSPVDYTPVDPNQLEALLTAIEITDANPTEKLSTGSPVEATSSAKSPPSTPPEEQKFSVKPTPLSTAIVPKPKDKPTAPSTGTDLVDSPPIAT